MNLGENIYTLRTKMNMSQTDLANEVDVSRQSISKWETGSAIPDLDKLIRLSKIFGVTLDELVGNETEAVDKTNEPVLMTQEQVDMIINDIRKECKPVPSKIKISDIIINIIGGILAFQGFMIFIAGLYSTGAVLFLAGISSILVKNEKLKFFIWFMFLNISTFLTISSATPTWTNLFAIKNAISIYGFVSIEIFICFVFICVYLGLSAWSIFKAKGKTDKLFALGWSVAMWLIANFLAKAVNVCNYMYYYFRGISVNVVEGIPYFSIISCMLSLVVAVVMVVWLVKGRKRYEEKISVEVENT